MNAKDMVAKIKSDGLLKSMALLDELYKLAMANEQRLSEQAEQVRQLTEQRDAVVSEFLQVKAVNDDRRVFIMNGVQLGYIKVPIVETDPALETIRIAVSPQQNTPTTSAILDSLRAEGADMCMHALVTSDDDDFTDAPNICATVARQLRESKGANHGN